MSISFPDTAYRGLLVIGDPHLEGRVPGFRKDDYPQAILGKLRWCLNYATGESLLPVILGDLFHLPRDNPNWLLGELMTLMDGEIIGIYGNHDVHENTINDNDTLSIIAKAGRLRLLGLDECWSGRINGRSVVIGGTAWGQWLPECFDKLDGENPPPFVAWLSHHDLIVPGYEGQGRIHPRELPGIDVVINGHIHRRLESVQRGCTLWMTPGNIARRSRSDAAREHVPAALRIDVRADGWTYKYIEVPHKPADEVFHEAVIDLVDSSAGSKFIAGLADLQARRTETGDTLNEFLDRNLHQFSSQVAEEIRRLAKEVIPNG